MQCIYVRAEIHCYSGKAHVAKADFKLSNLEMDG